MESAAQTPKQLATALCGLLPRRLSPDAIAEYGIEATPAQVQLIARELLSANLFWIHSALEAFLTDLARDLVIRELHGIIHSLLATEHQYSETEVGSYFEELKHRGLVYGGIMRGGGSAVAVLTETATILESNQAVRSEDQSKVMALLIDLVPFDSYGKLVEDVELAGE